MLKRGCTRFDDPFHCPVLGTTGRNDGSLRTVILRQFTLPDRILVCYTDARAAKTQEIRNNSNVNWLFYHPKDKIQLRINGKAELHTDDPFADEQWAATKITGRLDYCATQPPGTRIEKPGSGLPDFLLEKVPTLLKTEKGRKNFMTISCRIDSIDGLKLRTLGHRRARFVWDGNILNASWLIP